MTPSTSDLIVRLSLDKTQFDGNLSKFQGMSEDGFWRSTLRNLHAVFRCHCEHMPKPAGKK